MININEFNKQDWGDSPSAVLRNLNDISLNEATLYEYAVTIAQSQYRDRQAHPSMQVLSDIKFALDVTAIVAITDSQGIINYANDKFCQISKYSRSEIIGKDHNIVNSGYHSQSFFSEMWSTIQAGNVWKGEIKNKAKDGNYYWVDTTIVPLSDETGRIMQYLAIRLDITERKQIEEALQRSQQELQEKTQHLEKVISELQKAQSQLIQTEKMSSLGQLVAGIAHEINNPINFIYGNLVYVAQYTQEILFLLQLYHQYYPMPLPEIQQAIDGTELGFIKEDLPKVLKSMRLGSERIRQIVLSLRNFSRLDEAEIKSVNIHEGIDCTLLILQNRLKIKRSNSEITIVKEYGNLPLVECYAGQLNQVFMNIISNAIDELETAHKNSKVLNPKIWIRTKISGKNRITIAIADNGLGMTEDIRQKIFDPFFTTKPVGVGTGLGLSISYQIVVEKHRGQFTCISTPNAGAEFLIEIPIHPAEK